MGIQHENGDGSIEFYSYNSQSRPASSLTGSETKGALNSLFSDIELTTYEDNFQVSVASRNTNRVIVLNLDLGAPLECRASCQTCTGRTSQQCQSCTNGYSFDGTSTCFCPGGGLKATYAGEGSECRECDSLCATCGLTAFTCDSCDSSKHLEISGEGYKKTCTCMSGYSQLNGTNTCISCPIGCDSCLLDEDGTLSVCISCQDKYLLSDTTFLCEYPGTGSDYEPLSLKWTKFIKVDSSINLYFSEQIQSNIKDSSPSLFLSASRNLTTYQNGTPLKIQSIEMGADSTSVKIIVDLSSLSTIHQQTVYVQLDPKYYPSAVSDPLNKFISPQQKSSQ